MDGLLAQALACGSVALLDQTLSADGLALLHSMAALHLRPSRDGRRATSVTWISGAHGGAVASTLRKAVGGAHSAS